MRYLVVVFGPVDPHYRPPLGQPAPLTNHEQATTNFVARVFAVGLISLAEFGVTLTLRGQSASQDRNAAAIPVTIDNFVRTESDLYFAAVVKNVGFGKFDHRRDPAPLDTQTVMRLNLDTLYSALVFDLDAG